MDLENTSAEAKLKELSPQALDDDFLCRLLSCADATWSELSDEELAFENRMRSFRPSPLSHEYLATLENICCGPEESTVVAFPSLSPHRKLQTGLAAAAAIALLGAATALLVPNDHITGSKTARSSASSNPISQASSLNFAPVGYKRGLQETRDEGIVWQNGKPHRVMRVVYQDKITLHNDKGEKVEVEQPRVEYVLLPTKVD